MSDDRFGRNREPPPLAASARDDEPVPPPLPLIGEQGRPGRVAAAVVAQRPRLARALAPEVIRVAVAVGLTI
jgi:hypothetical protein